MLVLSINLLGDWLRDALNPQAAMTRPPLLEVQNLRVEFPTRRGTLVAVDDVSLRHRAGRGARRRRRIGRGQVAHRARRSSACSSRRAASPAARSGSRAGASTTCRPRQMRTIRGRRDRRDLPGSADLAQSALHDRPAARRDDPHAPAAVAARSARSARDRAARRSRHPGARAAHRPLPAPVLRRHAPARGDRARALRRTRSSSSPTSRPRRSTSRSRRRSSSCSSGCAASTAPR